MFGFINRAATNLLIKPSTTTPFLSLQCLVRVLTVTIWFGFRAVFNCVERNFAFALVLHYYAL